LRQNAVKFLEKFFLPSVTAFLPLCFQQRLLTRLPGKQSRGVVSGPGGGYSVVSAEKKRRPVSLPEGCMESPLLSYKGRRGKMFLRFIIFRKYF